MAGYGLRGFRREPEKGPEEAQDRRSSKALQHHGTTEHLLVLKTGIDTTQLSSPKKMLPQKARTMDNSFCMV